MIFTLSLALSLGVSSTLWFAPAVLPAAAPRGSLTAPITTGHASTATWPVTPAVIVGAFDPPVVRWGAGHRGIDLATAPGDEVVAAAAGIVTFADAVAGRGVVVVDHGLTRTTYEPVHATVVVGAWVDVGDSLGTIAPGSGHCGSGACLHWGLVRGDTYLDPRLLLGLRPVLKPVAARR